MNSSASRACRADRRAGNVQIKIPKAFKRRWLLLTQKQKSKLRTVWHEAQRVNRAVGDSKWKMHREALEKGLIK